MKKIALLLAVFVICRMGFSQTILYHENFELPSLADSVVSSGNPGWFVSTKLFNSGLRSDTSKVAVNDSTYLTTATFSTLGYSNVILQFSHICKVEFFDNATIEVSNNNGATWTQLVAAQYLGSGQFGSNGNKFASTSYADWLPGTPAAVPTNAWWKNEQFDISALVGNAAQVKVRFKLKDGNGTGAASNYGWLIDDILINASVSELIPPTITLNSPVLQDTVYTTGPFNVSATITDASGIQWAKVVYKINAATQYDTVLMTNTSGNIFTAQIPSYTYNTKVWYRVIATDNSLSHNFGQNPTSGDKWFYIKQGPTVVVVGTGTSTQYYLPFYGYYNYSWGAMVYKADEINYSGQIDSIAFYVGNAPASYVMNNQKVFIGHTTASTYGTTQPDTTNMTVAFAGNMTFNGGGWYKIKVQNAFMYNGTSNLLVYWTNRDGSYASGYPTFAYTATTSYLGTYNYSDTYSTVFPTSSGTQTYNRPNIRIAFIATNFADDAGISQLVEPTGIVLASTSLPVKVTVKNFGTNNLTSATINWKLDGVLQTSYPWTGNLAQAVSSSAITIANTSFTPGNHTIKVWTTLPNGNADQYALNDTVTGSFYACTSILNGTYTIGPSGADFPSFAAAYSAMQNCGISGPVVFNVQSGTYTEQLLFPEISGASATNTITFQSATGVNTDVTLQFAGTSSANYVVKMNGADHFRFKNMTIKNTGTTYGRVIELAGNAINNQFDGNRITGISTTSTAADYALIYSVAAANSLDSMTVINNNILTNGSYGVYLAGASTTSLESQTSVTNNTFTNQYIYGMYLYYQNAPLISGNTITTNSANTGYFGIYAGYCDNNLRILKNKIAIANGGYGIEPYYCDGTATKLGLIANNFVSMAGTTTAYGLYPYYSTYQNFYYNSVNITSTSATAGRAIYVYSGCSALEVKNNVLVNNGGGYAFYSGITSGVTSNYNDLYTSGTNIGYWSTNQTTFAAWKTASSQDANSVNITPGFISSTNLHTFDSGLNGLATPLASVTDDIDGDPRNATTPDIGADEFTPLATDLGIISVIAPVTGCGLGTTENVTIQLKNLGNNPITTADIYYRINNGTPVHEVFTGSIASNATYNYTFTTQANLSNTANYTFKFYVSLAGDMNLLNDTLSNYVISNGWDFYTAAYTMGFEPSDNMTQWSKLDVNADTRTWEFPYNSTTYSRTGSNSARFFNGTTNPGNDWMFSRCFTLSAGSTYKIEYWYRVESATYPQSVDLKVGSAATPAGMTTTLVTMPGFTNTTYQKATATFAPSTTGTYYFGWYAYSAAANYYAFVDDINISVLPIQEASVLSIESPVAGCGLGNENVTIKISNNGSSAINGNLTAYYKPLGGTTVSQAVTATIAPAATYNFTFTTPLNMAVVNTDSTFTLSTWVKLVGDPFATNDSISKDIKSYHVPANPVVISDTVPYGGIATLHAISTDSLYWYNVPTGGLPIGTGAHFTTPPLYINTVYYVEAKTGAPSLKFTEIATYRTGTGQTPTYPAWCSGADLIEITNLGSAPQNLQGYTCEIFGVGARLFNLPNIDLPAGQVMVLCAGTGTDSPANYYYNMGGTSDAISSGSASGFVLKDGAGVVVDAVAMNSYAFLPASGVTATDWTGNTASTSGLAGIIRTISDNNNVSDWILSSTTNTQTLGTFNPMLTAGSGGGGCASARVPDTAYVELLAVEAGIISMPYPVGGCSDGLEDIIIKIRNNGNDTVDPGFTASYKLNAAAPVTETVNSQILPGDTLTYTFTTPLVTGLSSANIDSLFNIKAYITIPTDVFASNDTITKSVTLNFTPNPPMVNNVSTPYGTTATLNAVSTDSVFWYSSPSSQTELAIGSSYTTPVLYSNTVYYAEASIYSPGHSTTVGNGTVNQYYIPFYGFYDYGWSAMLFNANEMGFAGRIDTIAVYVNNTVSGYQMLAQSMYLAETNDMTFATADKPDPATMTLVFTNDLTWNGPGWYKIALQTPFNYSGTKSLMLYWENNDGDYVSGYPTFNATTTTGNLAKYDYQDGSFPTDPGTLTTTRTNVRFIHTAKGCSSARVADTVFVTGAPTCDAGVTAINSPNTGIELSANEVVSVQVKNYGIDPAVNIPVKYVINGGTPVIETIAGPIASNATVNYTFVTTANLSAFATYQIKAYTDLSCDLTHVNDTFAKTVINNPLVYCTSAPTSPTAYEDIGNVTISNVNNGIATPVTNNTTAVNGYSDFTTTVPAVQLALGVTYPISVSVISASSFYSTYVKAFIDYNRDGVFDPVTELAFGGQTTSTTPTITGNVIVPLNAVTGQTTRMRVVAVETTTASSVLPCGTYTWGETEDYSVIIAPLIPKDAGVIEIINPVAVQSQGDVVIPKVRIKNFGTDTLKTANNMTVVYKINGGTPVSTAWTGTLAPNAVDTVLLTSFTVLPGSNNICAYTVLSGDTNTFNDQTCKAFYGTPNVDAGVIAVLQPGSQVMSGSTIPVKVVFKNFGTTAITSMNVNYKVNGGAPVVQAWSGNLLPNAQDTLVLASATAPASNFTVCAYTSLSGDGDATNDTLCKAVFGVPSSTLPYYDNFEGTAMWYNTTVAPGSVWELGTPSYGVTNNAHSPTKAWDVNLSTEYGASANCQLYTQMFDFTGIVNAKLSFWRNHYTEASYDGTHLEYTTDGTTWQTLGSIGDPLAVNWYTNTITGGGSHQAWAGTSSGWVKSEYILTPLNNQPMVQFRFVFKSDPSVQYDGFSIDDFSITIPSPIDAGVEAITKPGAQTSDGTSYDVKIRIKNYGMDTLQSIPVAYTINGGVPVTATWTGYLVPNDTVSYTFPQTFVSPAGQFNLCAYTSLAADGDHLNDTVCKSITGIPIFNLPYSDDFEGVNYWLSSDGTAQWEWGVPSASTINTAHSPTHAWGTNIDGNYVGNMNDNLYSPVFNLSAQMDTVILEFWHWYNTEAGADGGSVQYTVNGGANWITLGYVGDPLATNWYTTSVAGKGYWMGNSSGWVKSTYKMPKNIDFGNFQNNIQFRFNFISNASTHYNGWAIDDFGLVIPPIANDAGVSAIVTPFGETNAYTSTTVTVTIKNFGTNTLTSIPVKYKVGTATPVAETWTGSLAPNATANYTFTATYVSPAAPYNFCAYTTLAGDTYNFNDTTCIVLDTLPPLYDAGISAIVQPSGMVSIGSNVTVVATIENFGLNTLTSVPVTYIVNGGTPVTETWTGTLLSGAQTNYTFTAPFIGVNLPSYTLCVKTALVGDNHVTNDQKCVTLTGNVGIGESSLPGFYLGQNIPNPASSGTTVIEYIVPQQGQVRFSISNSIGETIFVSENSVEAGSHKIEIPTDNLGSGVYYYYVDFNGYRLFRKMAITR